MQNLMEINLTKKFLEPRPKILNGTRDMKIFAGLVAAQIHGVTRKELEQCKDLSYTINQLDKFLNKHQIFML